MAFIIDTFSKGRMKEATNVNLDRYEVTDEFGPSVSYKYLGIHEGKRVKYSLMKKGVRKECYCKVRNVLKTGVNAKGQNRIGQHFNHSSRDLHFQYH